jgi:hypothetical protein
MKSQNKCKNENMKIEQNVSPNKQNVSPNKQNVSPNKQNVSPRNYS